MRTATFRGIVGSALAIAVAVAVPVAAAGPGALSDAIRGMFRARVQAGTLSNNDVLAYQSSTGTWTNIAASTIATSGGWTDDGTTVRLTTATDQVGIGTASPNAGDALSLGGRVGWVTGLGAITHIQGPSDQNLQIQGGASRDVQITASQDIRLGANGGVRLASDLANTRWLFQWPLAFATGLGAITHITGPTDQPLNIQSGTGRDLNLSCSTNNIVKLDATGAGYVTLQTSSSERIRLTPTGGIGLMGGTPITLGQVQWGLGGTFTASAPEILGPTDQDLFVVAGDRATAGKGRGLSLQSGARNGANAGGDITITTTAGGTLGGDLTVLLGDGGGNSGRGGQGTFTAGAGSGTNAGGGWTFATGSPSGAATAGGFTINCASGVAASSNGGGVIAKLGTAGAGGSHGRFDIQCQNNSFTGLSIDGTGAINIGATAVSATKGQIAWTTGLGAITHVLGPTDQPLQLASAANQGLTLQATTGTLALSATGANAITLATNGTTAWKVDSSGFWTAAVDNTFDIGATASTLRPRTAFLGTALNVANGGVVVNGTSVTGPASATFTLGSGTGNSSLIVQSTGNGSATLKASGATGTVLLSTANSAAGSTGSISLTSGNGTAGNAPSGDITFTTGSKNGSGTVGSIVAKTNAGTEIFRADGSNDTFSLSKSVSKYANVATAGWGLPAIYGSGRVTGQTAANSSIATYTVGAADGSFEVHANVLVTTATTHAFTVTCAYTDESNTARTATMSFFLVAGTTVTTSIANANGPVPYQGIPIHIRCKASTAITIATTGTFTTVVYNAEGTIQQVQ